MRIKLHYRKRSNGLPILSMKEIDDIAELILSDFNVSALKDPAPVDVEALLEFYLGLSLDYQDLTHNRSILGMTVFNDCHIPVYNAENNTAKIIPVRERTVLIDNSLLEEEQKGRYRFTLGHEASHWILHRDKYLENKQQTSLIKAEEAQPIIKCRSKSKIRNKGIAEVFNRMKIIEEWGTGISRIISGCKEYGLSEPEFMEIGDSFRVNIFRKPENTLPQEVKSSQESSQESSKETLNKTQNAILELIRENNAITQEEMSARIGVSFGAIKKNVSLLKEKGILVRTGSTKKGSWTIRGVDNN